MQRQCAHIIESWREMVSVFSPSPSAVSFRPRYLARRLYKTEMGFWLKEWMGSSLVPEACSVLLSSGKFVSVLALVAGEQVPAYTNCLH